MNCIDCGNKANVLAQGRCLACNDKHNIAGYPEFDATEGGGKLLAFLEKLSQDMSNGVIVLPSGKRLIAIPQRS